MSPQSQLLQSFQMLSLTSHHSHGCTFLQGSLERFKPEDLSQRFLDPALQAWSCRAAHLGEAVDGGTDTESPLLRRAARPAPLTDLPLVGAAPSLPLRAVEIPCGISMRPGQLGVSEHLPVASPSQLPLNAPTGRILPPLPQPNPSVPRPPLSALPRGPAVRRCGAG